MDLTKRELIAAAGASLFSAAASTHATTRVSADRHLSNASASEEAKSLYRFLWDTWGKRTLTGQQESTWVAGPTYELDYIEKTTGKLPAILGLDYIHPKDNANVNARTIAWYSRGGIPSICWHWGNPLTSPGYESSKTDFNLPEALKTGTPENKAMMRDMAEIANLLTQVRDAGVPILWRPLHEFTGNWFWWGRHGPEAFKRLWITMYNYFTYDRGLNNLIWVLGYTKTPSKAFFPGRKCVDIVGADNYADDVGPMKDIYDRVAAITGDTLPITLHENGPIPDPDQLTRSGAQWLWFLTWHTRWIAGANLNHPDRLKAVYNSERYVTLDELPDLRRYRVSR